jgi:hypothetical protein
MEEVALVKERRVSGTKFITFAWVSKNRIPLELDPIQPFSLYLDSAKCSLDNSTKAAWVQAG